MFKAITIGLLASAVCLTYFESAQAFGGRRRAAQSYASPDPVAAATTNGSVPTATYTVPNVTYQAPAQTYQYQRGAYPYMGGPRTQGPSYAYPNSDPRRFNFQYNH